MRPLSLIFAMPALFCVVTVVGLVAALVGDGPLDVLAWLTLALPLLPAILALAGARMGGNS